MLPENIENVLVIGASGGIAQACLSLLQNTPSVRSIVAVSRSHLSRPEHNTTEFVISDYSEDSIQRICQSLPNKSVDLVICTLGVLHQETGLFPEKKIEDLNTQSLQHYFEVNSIIPTLWLKHLVKKMRKGNSHIVLLSARVGSISDNQLGGWYGYRASKAALNMLVKTAQVEYQRRSPGCELILYHPGTVDTALSQPFQANVKPEKLFTPEFTATRLMELFQDKPDIPPPYYLDWQHQLINW